MRYNDIINREIDDRKIDDRPSKWTDAQKVVDWWMDGCPKAGLRIGYSKQKLSTLLRTPKKLIALFKM